ILSKGAQDLKSSIHRELIKRLDLDKLMLLPDERTKQQLLGVIRQLIGQQEVPLSALECDALAREVMDEVFGFGPLEPLLQDPTVNDILVNTYKTVYVERNGVLEETKVVFKDNVHLMHIIDKIVSGRGAGKEDDDRKRHHGKEYKERHRHGHQRTPYISCDTSSRFISNGMNLLEVSQEI